MATAAAVIADTLRAWGVARVFGMPGLHTLELCDALADAGIAVVLATDERAAAFMADAQARSGGGLGVVTVVPGPGATNAVTGLAEALLDGSPVLVLAPACADLPPRVGRMHAIDQAALLRPVTKAVVRIDDPARIPALVGEAIAIALAGHPGPVVLELPVALLARRLRLEPAPAVMPAVAAGDGAVLAAIAADLHAAPAVGIYAGAGAFAAPGAVQALAERLGAPVATTLSGRGVLPEDHPQAVGVGFGPGAAPWARRAFARVHTLLAVGCRFSESATAGWSWTLPPRLIHIDREPAHLGANYPADRALAADCAWALPALAAMLADIPCRTPPAGIVAARDRHRQRILARHARTAGVSPDRFLHQLRAALPRAALLTCDSGNHLLWAMQEFAVLAPRSFLAPADFQAMGFALPAAIAAQLAHPGRRVVALLGDGGLLLSGMELATARRLGLPLLVVVFADGALGLIREAQDHLCRRRTASTLAAPHAASLAAAFGCGHVRIADDAGIGDGLARALAADGPVLVEVAVRYQRPTRFARAIAITAWRNRPLADRLRMAGRLGINRVRAALGLAAAEQREV